MKKVTLLTLLFLLSSTASAKDALPVKAPCQATADEIANIQKAQYDFTGANGVPLSKLQQQYDEQMAIYNAMKGVKDLKDSYLDFNEKVRSLTLGTEKDTLLQTLKNFVVKPYNKSHEEFIEWNKNLREGATATASILAVENSLTEIYKRKYKPEMTGEEFYTQVEEGCKARPGDSALCKEILSSTELFGINSSIHNVMVGFYDTYSTLQKAKSAGQNEVEIEKSKKEIVADYRKLLLDELPSVDYMKDQLTMTKTYLEKSTKQYDSGKECLIKYAADSASSCAATADALARSVKNYSKEMKKIIEATDSKLGKDELKAFQDNATTAAFENQIGKISNVVKSLKEPIREEKNKLHETILAQHQLLNNRRNLMAGSGPELGPPLGMEDIYKKAFSFLTDNISTESCKFLSRTGAKPINEKALLACLYEFQKRKGSDSKEIERRIDDSKKKIDGLRDQIVEIQKNEFYQSHDKMKHMLASDYVTNCSSEENKNCDGVGVIGIAGQVQVLRDNSGNIIAELEKSLNKSSGSELSKNNDEFVDLCRDKSLNALAQRTCKRRDINTSLDDVRKTYHFSYNPKTKKFEPEDLKATWGEVFGSNFEIPTSRISSFMQRWNYNNNMMQFNEDYGKGMKTYNYQLEQYLDVWGDYAYPYYNNFNTTLWGSNGMYPSFYNPLNSTQFGFGNSSIYTSGSLEGFDFSQ